MDEDRKGFARLQQKVALIPPRRAATVARRAGIYPGYLSALRNGVKKNPSVKKIEAISRAIDEVLGGSVTDPEPPASISGFDLMLWLVAHRRCPFCGHPQ